MCRKSIRELEFNKERDFNNLYPNLEDSKNQEDEPNLFVDPMSSEIKSGDIFIKPEELGGGE